MGVFVSCDVRRTHLVITLLLLLLAFSPCPCFLSAPCIVRARAHKRSPRRHVRLITDRVFLVFFAPSVRVKVAAQGQRIVSTNAVRTRTPVVSYVYIYTLGLIQHVHESRGVFQNPTTVTYDRHTYVGTRSSNERSLYRGILFRFASSDEQLRYIYVLCRTLTVVLANYSTSAAMPRLDERETTPTTDVRTRVFNGLNAVWCPLTLYILLCDSIFVDFKKN